MNKRAYLRSNEGIFSLSPKITIIGRDSCDFIIQNITVDSQQAVIEYFENEDCFILKDLNSTHGTYVNECRIQNASVRLTDGDVIKFGYSTGQYEFHSESDIIEGDLTETTTYTQIPISQRQSWQPNVVQQAQPSTSTIVTTLPIINYQHPQQIQQRHTVSGFGPWAQLPRAPSSNPRLGRPMSANGLNRRQITPTAPLGSSSSCSTYRRGSVSGPTKQFLPDSRPLPVEDDNILELHNEVERLRFVEIQCQEKSKQIESLMQQNSDISNNRNRSMNDEIYGTIRELTDEVSRKCNEVERLNRLVEKISEGSNRHNTNTSNNESDFGIMKQEMEKMRKDLKISHGLVTTLQKDLSNRDDAVKKLNRDVELLNNTLAEKDVSISALMNKLTRLKDVQEQIQEEESEKQDKERELMSLKHKLKAAESSNQEKNEQLAPLTKLVEELQLTEKRNSDTIRDLSQQLEESKAIVEDLKRSESLLRVDAKESENKYEKFRSKVLHVALSTPGFKSDNGYLKDDELIEMMKELVKSKVEHDLRICEKQKLIDSEIHKNRQFVENIDQFKLKLKNVFEKLSSGERTSNKIQQVINAIESFPLNDDDCLQKLKDVVVENLRREMEFLADLESCISDVGPELANLSLSECFKRIIERSIDAVENKTLATGKLAEVLETHEEEMKRLKKEHEEEINSKILEAIDKENSRITGECQALLEEALNAEHQKNERLSKEFGDKIEEYERNIESLQKIIKEKDLIHQHQVVVLEEKIKRVEILETELQEMTESKSILEQTLCEQFDTINQKWKSEIDTYKEEITQHSITISSLNDRLIKLDKENKDLFNQLTKIRTEKKPKEARKVNETEENNPVLVSEINNFNATVANLERCVSALRHENVLLKNKNREHEDTLKGLNMDLAGAEARLSDLKGELSESQKNEIDKLNIEIQKYEDEANELRVQMSKMSGIIDNLTQELEDKKIENKNLNQQLTEERSKVQEKENKIQDLESNLAFEKENWLHHIDQIEQEGRISTELATVGSQCRGDRHVQIIEAQKMALTELRQKLKTMEMTRPTSELGGLFENAFSTMFQESTLDLEPRDTNFASKIAQGQIMAQIKNDSINDTMNIYPKLVKNSNVPEITQQMWQLKKELSVLRASQALRESSPNGNTSLKEVLANRNSSRKPMLSLTEAGKQTNGDDNKLTSAVVEKAEALKANKQIKFDLDVAKATQFDLKASFELSEESYFQLMRHLLETLELETLRGLRTFDNLSYEAKEGLKLEREETCGMIVQKIRILKEMIQRKDELLHSYEKDLVKLKQAEDLTSKTQAQMEFIVQQTRSKSEEVDLLRETLNRTKDLLNQEKRVNNAIKQNKHYVPEKSSSKSQPASESPKYHCPPEDIMAKEKQVEKKKTEKVKRKNYEIKSLKSELYNKEKELSQATNRLYSLETTMGIKSEEPVA